MSQTKRNFDAMQESDTDVMATDEYAEGYAEFAVRCAVSDLAQRRMVAAGLPTPDYSKLPPAPWDVVLQPVATPKLNMLHKALRDGDWDGQEAA